MVREAEAAAPMECCGLLLGSGDSISAILPARNVHETSETAFLIDPAVLVQAQRTARAGDADIVGYYHSHPNGRTGPSPCDRAQALPDDRIWAIIANGDVRFWKAVADQDNNGLVAFMPVTKA